MNQYIFFTAEGTTFPPKEGKDVDNCQLLGRANGETFEEAKSNLFKKNPWIEELGFDCDYIIAEQVLTEEQRKDIQTLVEYFLSEQSGNEISYIVNRLKHI